MKVILRIATGITTKTLNLPEHIVRTEYKVPLYPPMKSALFNQIQDALTPESTHQKCLIFRWNGKDKWGSGSPIMDLVDYF